MNNKIFKLLCSMPIILISLYYIPFLGICLILFRYYIYKNDRYYTSASYLIITGILLLLPKIINYILKYINVEFNGFDLNSFISSNTYINLISYSKLLIVVGVIFLIISYILSNTYLKFTNKIRSYMHQERIKDIQISKENDLLIKERQEKAKNTSFVSCPNCGADNILTDKVSSCSYCRSSLINKDYK